LTSLFQFKDGTHLTKRVSVAPGTGAAGAGAVRHPLANSRDPQDRRLQTPARLGAPISLDSMSYSTYTVHMSPIDKPLVWLRNEIKTPPLTKSARLQAGFLLRRLQQGEKISMPDSREMSSIGRRCHVLRIIDESDTWRIIYRIDEDAIVSLEVFSKKTKQTPKRIIDTCKARLRDYDST